LCSSSVLRGTLGFVLKTFMGSIPVLVRFLKTNKNCDLISNPIFECED
jgi:hypothetical protein